MTKSFPTRPRRRATRARPNPWGCPRAEALEGRALLSAQLVKDLLPGPDGGQPTMLTAFGDRLVFATAGALEEHGLWVSDGTEAGTTRILSATIGHDAYENRRSIATFGADLLFNGPGGLWKTDGTAAGTSLVKWLDPFYGSYAYDLTESGGLMYFVHKDAWYREERLWRTDGTADGTVMVPDGDARPEPPVSPGGDSSVPGGAVRVGASTWYFTANAASELWKTDGTPDGASLVKAFPPNPNQGITSLTDGAGTLFFVVNDGISGYELWRSDGTEAGTVRVDDINPGPAHSRPGLLTVVDGRLFFTADDGQHGDELWKVDLPLAAPAAPTAAAATPVSGGEIRVSWEHNSDNEAGFVVERSATTDFAAVASSVKLLPGARDHVDTGLDAGTIYFYRVRAFNRAGASPDANTAGASTPAAPAAPAAVSAVAVSHARVDLAWTDNSSDETGFRIERSRVSNFGTTDAAYDVGPDVRAFSDTAVSPETDYFYRVAAVGPAGRSAAPRAHAGTPGRPPTALEAWGVSATEIDLRWDNPQGAGPFSLRLDRAGPGEEFAEAERFSSRDTSYADRRKRPNTVYRYRVRAVGPFGPTLPSNEVSVTTPPPVLATLVKDLNTTDTPAGSDPSPVVLLNGVGYFAAYDETHGRELWRTDGTPSGTRRVLDLMPGPDGGVYSYPGAPSYAGAEMLAVNGALYFRGDDGSHGHELWKTDGTEAGTVLVADLAPGASGIAPSWLTDASGTLFFVSATRDELWKSDGTAAGTVRVKGFLRGSGQVGPGNLTARKGIVYFTATDGEQGTELWRSDGTAAGTYRLSDVAPGGPGNTVNDAHPQSLTFVGDTLYFTAASPSLGRALYKSDGTPQGTVLVRDVSPGPAVSDPQNLFAQGETLLFTSGDLSTGTELWRSDGTEAGTTLLADLAPGPFGSAPLAFTRFKGKTFFLAWREGLSVSLYETDGTSAGTRRVKDLPDGSADPPTNMIVVGDSLYLIAVPTGDVGGRALWKSDGTEAGTVMLSSPFGAFPPAGRFSSLGDIVLFPVDEGYGGAGSEMWRSDGTAAGTHLLKDIRVLNGSSSPGNLTAANGLVYFTLGSDAGFHGTLWRSDGTDAGTVRVAERAAAGLVVAGARVFFRSPDEAGGDELWTTDGTAEGTRLVKDITPGPAGSVLLGMTAAPDGSLYFAARAADSGDHSYRLWRSDGTEAGTYLVADPIVQVEGDLYPGPFISAVGSTVFFRASSPGAGMELWKTDGTPGGTAMVTDLYPGPGGSGPTRLTSVGNALYFYATDAGGRHLFRTDGTTAGTVPVNDIAGAPQPGIPIALGSLLIFAAADPAHGSEPWRSDGTPEGTFMLSDVFPGTESSAPSEWTVVGDTLYFLASTSRGRRALWKTDGTREGTVRVRPVEGPGGTYAFYMLNANGTLFFSDGGRLWRSDGTPQGTLQVLEIADGITDLQYYLGSPAAVLGDRVYVRGYDKAHGRELWSVATAAPAAPSAPAAAVLGGGQVRVSWRDNASDETGFLVDRIAGASSGLLAADGGDVVERTFFVDADHTEFIDSTLSGTGAYRYRVRAVNAAGRSAPTGAVRPGAIVPAVAGRHVFYNHSALDGGDATANAADDGAIATDKAALLPGQTPSFANLTSYDKGINGVMIDIVSLPASSLTAADFDFGDSRPPFEVSVRPGAGVGGSDRVTLLWTDFSPLARSPTMATVDGWLRVTVKANANTGLSQPDVFSFGNMIGETGDGTAASGWRVSALDLSAVRRALNAPTSVASATDFNRDGRTNALDLAAVRRALNQAIPLPVALAAFTDGAAVRSVAEELGLGS